MNLYNHTSNIRYPFTDDQVLTFENDVVLDFKLQIEGGALTGVPQVYVKLLERNDLGFLLTLGVTGGSDIIFNLIGFPTDTINGYRSYVGSYLTAKLLIVLGPGALLGGTTVITGDPGFLIRTDCVIDMRSAEVTQFTLGGSFLIGDVVLKPGRNAKITSTANSVSIGFELDSGYYTCDGSGVVDCSKFLRYINGAGPDNAQSVTISGGNGVSVVNIPAEHAIEIRTTTSDECTIQ